MCNCINQTDELLAKEPGNNTRLDLPILFNQEKGMRVSMQLSVLTTKIDDHKRKPPVRIFASYCPFCGEKYADD